MRHPVTAFQQRQRGVVLLATTIMLAIVGALAYSLTTAGAMNGQAVNAQYDTAAAGYLAEAGVHVARWRAQQRDCSDTALSATTALAGMGSYATTVSAKKTTFDISSEGVGPGGARAVRSRTAEKGYEKTLRSMDLPGGKDTYLASANGNATMQTLSYMEVTTGTSHGLMQWDMPADMDKALVASALLTLVQYQANSTQSGQLINLHRVTADWKESDATWTIARDAIPWASAGGSYAAVPFASITPVNGSLTWDVTTLVSGWVDNDYGDFGLMMRGAGPVLQTRLYSFQSTSATRPVLTVGYYRKC